MIVPTDCHALCVPSRYTLAPGPCSSAPTAYCSSAIRSLSVKGYTDVGNPQSDGMLPSASGSRMTIALPLPMPWANALIHAS